MLHHELGVPRRIWMSESLTGGDGAVEGAQAVCLFTSVYVMYSTSLRDNESCTENRMVWDN